MKRENKEFYNNLARIALPISLQSLMLAAVAAGDAFMLGKVAQDEMALSTGGKAISIRWKIFLI